MFIQFHKGFNHVLISQYGKAGKGFLWCSNNFSRVSPWDLGLNISNYYG